MKKNESIEIHQVLNGYMIRMAYNPAIGNRVNEPFAVLVFQSFSELSNWLSEHFDHRIGCVLVDFKSE